MINMGYLTMDMDYVRGIEAELEAYRDTGLTPEEIQELKADRDYWEHEAKKWCAKLGEIKFLTGEQN
jgi:hypothetical protein